MAGLTWHKLTRRKQTQTGGQEEGYMMALQMDPAPGLAAGKGTMEKVWDPKKKRCSSPMHDNEPGASSMHDDEPAGVIDDEVDESKFVTACGALSKQKGAFEIKHVPASFWKREAFSQLSSKGLAKVPPGEGWQIAYHSQTQQWHARCPQGWNYAPTWGSIRSELKALCLALQQLWDWYIQQGPPDVAEANLYIAQLEEFSNSLKF